MKKSIAFALSLLSLTLAPAAFAKTDKINTRITQVYVNTSQILIRLESGTTGESCPANDWALIEQGVANPNAKEMLDVATAAYLAGRTVDVRLNGCSTYPKVGFIAMH